MAKATKINHLDSDLEITESNRSWIITDKVNFPNGFRAIYENGTLNTKVTLEGRISGSDSGVYSTGTNFNLTVAHGGKLTASSYAAATSYGTNFALTNDGWIQGTGATAVRLHGDAAHVVNNARITADSNASGIFITGDAARIENEKGGTISGGIGIWFAQDEDAIGHLTNNGKIVSLRDQAVVGSNGQDVMINHGKIVGTVGLGNGDDRFDNRGGTISVKDIRGHGGDDTLITDDAAYKLVELAGGGNDTVKSTVSYKLDADSEVENLVLIGGKNLKATGSANAEHITGNAGNNRILGLSGSDTIAGNRGNDRITGGSDADDFVFRTGDGRDVITDFEHASDELYLGSWHKLASFDDVMDHAKFKGGDMTISFGKDQIILLGVAKGELDDGDFNFSIA